MRILIALTLFSSSLWAMQSDEQTADHLNKAAQVICNNPLDVTKEEVKLDNGEIAYINNFQVQDPSGEVKKLSCELFGFPPKPPSSPFINKNSPVDD